jgi:hypothetical protein
MQVFFAAVGASANVGLVVRTAPVLFCFSFIALGAHLGLMLGVGRLMGLTRRDLLLASNANIGGELLWVEGLALRLKYPSICWWDAPTSHHHTTRTTVLNCRGTGRRQLLPVCGPPHGWSHERFCSM